MDYNNNNYHSKYVKYKNKYLSLKKNLIGGFFVKSLHEAPPINLIGGSYDDIVSQFLLKHKESLNTSEFFKFLLNKTETQLVDLNPENVKIYLGYIQKLNDYIYSKLSDISKAKPIITIFSYSIGNGIVEALFALYLIHIHHKLVNIVYFDVFNFTELLKSYSVFTHIIGFHQKLTSLLIQLQLNKLLESQEKLPKLSNMYKKFDDNTDISIDLFIANNPQGYKYIPRSEIDKIPKIFPDFIENKENMNRNISNVYKYIQILTTPEQQQSIPMLWFIWGRDFNLDNIEFSLKQIYDLPEIKEQYNINYQFALSTLNNINKIFEVDI